jgi:hypothetical protein
MRVVLYWLALLAGTADFAVAQRMVDYVPPSLLQDPAVASNRLAFLSTTNLQTAAAYPRPVTAADRWDRFETEFGVKQPYHSAVRDSIQAAKYHLDKATFTIQEWLNSIEDQLRFDYGWNDLGMPVPAPEPYRATSSPGLVDVLLSARLQSDVDLRLAGGSFVGVKLVLPLGN